jgi:hypothetical protein
MRIDHILQTWPRDVFHDDPALLVGIKPDVKQGDQIGMFQVHALAHATHFDVQIALNLL